MQEMLAIIVLGVFLYARNACTLKVRLWFIDNEYNKYKELPSYESMFVNPKYFHLWTTKQWLSFLEKNNV